MEFTGERCVIGKSGNVIEKEHLDRYIFASKYVKDKIVLDIACGSGYGTKMLSKKAKKVYGADISEESISYAKKKYKNRNITYYVADATNIKFLKDESVDVVTSFETIEHIPKYKIFLREVKRVLKKDGIAIISTPNKKYSSPYRKKPLYKYHVIEFYYREYNELLRNYFSKIRFFGQDYQKNIKAITQIIITFIPLRIRKKIPKPLREKYNQISKSKKSQIRYAKEMSNYKFMLAICKK